MLLLLEGPGVYLPDNYSGTLHTVQGYKAFSDIKLIFGWSQSYLVRLGYNQVTRLLMIIFFG